MAQSNNPFNFDPSKMFTIDPQQMMAQWQTALESINLPGVDMSKILDAQRKNVEAITQANRIALEGVQSLMQRQAEIMQQSVEEATKMMQNFDPASASPSRRHSPRKRSSRRSIACANSRRWPTSRKPRRSRRSRRASPNLSRRFAAACRSSASSPQRPARGAGRKAGPVAYTDEASATLPPPRPLSAWPG